MVIYKYGEHRHANCFAVHAYGTAYVPTVRHLVDTSSGRGRRMAARGYAPMEKAACHLGVKASKVAGGQSPRRDNSNGNIIDLSKTSIRRSSLP